MIKEICRKSNSIELGTDNEITENYVEFDAIVKFLIAQKTVMDHAGLN
jgi:hypothetical protein